MKGTTKGLLWLSIASLLAGLALNVGLVNVRDLDALYVLFPVGAIFLGLFLIAWVLEKESAHYDEEQRAAAKRVGSSQKHPEVKDKNEPGKSTN